MLIGQRRSSSFFFNRFFAGGVVDSDDMLLVLVVVCRVQCRDGDNQRSCPALLASVGVETRSIEAYSSEEKG